MIYHPKADSRLFRTWLVHNVNNMQPDVIEIEHCWIPMSDGIHLSARLWLPEKKSKARHPQLSNISLTENGIWSGCAMSEIIRFSPATATPAFESTCAVRVIPKA